MLFGVACCMHALLRCVVFDVLVVVACCLSFVVCCSLFVVGVVCYVVD